MSMARLFLRELRFRAGTFVLALLGVATFAACLIGSRAFLAAHDHRTGQLTAALEERSEERMTALRDEARKFSKNLGFNCMMLPRGQKLGELYADGRSQRFFVDADVSVLAEARLETLNHLRPVLRERIHWPEQNRDIILVGVRGEVYIKAPRWQKPIEEAIQPGQAHLGQALASELNLQPGGTLEFQQRTLTVGHILPQAGNEDDITLRVDLEIAQELLKRPGQVSAVLGLMCDCADGDPEIVLREVEKFVAGIQVVDFTSRVQARQQARSAIAKGTEAQLEDIKASRAALRDQVAAFAKLLTVLVSAGMVLLLGVLTLNNARQRRGEVAMLSALGIDTKRILGLFLIKALLTGLVGGVAGCLLGMAGSQFLAGPGATVSPMFAVVVLAFSVGMAVLASLIPAASAAMQDPAGILNQE
jgi:putative ABC transport system permease protein